MTISTIWTLENGRIPSQPTKDKYRPPGRPLKKNRDKIRPSVHELCVAMTQIAQTHTHKTKKKIDISLSVSAKELYEKLHRLGGPVNYGSLNQKLKHLYDNNIMSRYIWVSFWYIESNNTASRWKIDFSETHRNNSPTEHINRDIFGFSVSDPIVVLWSLKVGILALSQPKLPKSVFVILLIVPDWSTD